MGYYFPRPQLLVVIPVRCENDLKPCEMSGCAQVKSGHIFLKKKALL